MATSYTNPGGSGNRNSIMQVWATNATHTDPTSLIDGTTADNVFWFNNASGVIIEFWFSSRKIIDEAKFYQSGAVTHGVYQWQGSNNKTTWTNIGSTFTLGVVATQTITALNGNTTAYVYYRLFQTSGSNNGGPYVHEFEFKIDEGGTTSYLHALGTGDRSSSITITSSGISWSGLPSYLVNGNKGGQAFWDNASVAGHWLAFDFGASYVVQEARFYFTGTIGNQGDWKFQGSPNGSTWTDLSAAITLSTGVLRSYGVITIITGFENYTTAYRHYRFLGVSGTRNNGPFEAEVEFMVGAASSGITLVSSVTGIRGSATSAIDTTGASLIVIGTGNAFGPATISDSKSNTWTPLTLNAPGSGNHRFFYALSPTVGSGHTFTVSGSYASCIVYAFANAVAYHSESGGGSSGSGQPIATGSVTPSSNGALIVTGITANTGATDAVTPGFGTVTQINNSGGVNLQNSAAWQIQATAATITPTWTWTAGSHDYTGASTAVFLETVPSAASIRVTQDIIELLSQPMPIIRTTQYTVELLSSSTGVPSTETTQFFIIS